MQLPIIQHESESCAGFKMPGQTASQSSDRSDSRSAAKLFYGFPRREMSCTPLPDTCARARKPSYFSTGSRIIERFVPPDQLGGGKCGSGQFDFSVAVSRRNTRWSCPAESASSTINSSPLSRVAICRSAVPNPVSLLYFFDGANLHKVECSLTRSAMIRPSGSQAIDV